MISKIGEIGSSFEGKETVISIESNRGLAGSATIEAAEGEDDLEAGIIRAFSGAGLGWRR